MIDFILTVLLCMSIGLMCYGNIMMTRAQMKLNDDQSKFNKSIMELSREHGRQLKMMIGKEVEESLKDKFWEEFIEKNNLGSDKPGGD